MNELSKTERVKELLKQHGVDTLTISPGPVKEPPYPRYNIYPFKDVPNTWPPRRPSESH